MLHKLVLATVTTATLIGCSGGSPGSQRAAESYLNGELKTWMTGQRSEATTMNARVRSVDPPIDYDILSVVTDQPDPLAFTSQSSLTDDYTAWPAFRANVKLFFTSEAGTEMNRTVTYRLTWNPNESRWFLEERF